MSLDGGHLESVAHTVIRFSCESGAQRQTDKQLRAWPFFGIHLPCIRSAAKTDGSRNQWQRRVRRAHMGGIEQALSTQKPPSYRQML